MRYVLLRDKAVLMQAVVAVRSMDQVAHELSGQLHEGGLLPVWP